MLGPLATPQNIARIRQEIELNEPPPYNTLPGWARCWGDFGRAIFLKREVLPELLARFGATLILGGAGAGGARFFPGSESGFNRYFAGSIVGLL